MDLSMFFTMSADVETFLGSGPTGDRYAAPVTVKGFLDDGIVRQVGSGGAEVQVSQTKFYCALSDASKFTPESRVTVNGRPTQVNYVRRRDADGFGGPSHTEVDLR
jgi:hypothetical protein